MAFTTLEILTEFAEATDRVPGGDTWMEQCQRQQNRDRRNGRLRYAKWIAKGWNRRDKNAYMKEYNFRRRDELLERKRLKRKEFREANPLPAKRPYVPRPYDPEIRKLRYAKAKETGHLSDAEARKARGREYTRKYRASRKALNSAKDLS